MNLFDLYKKHINPNPSGVEIHGFFKSFDLHGIVVLNPLDESSNNAIKKVLEENISECKEWILKNSKF